MTLLDITLNSLSVINVIIQFTAAYISYRVYSFNRASKGWLAITGALLLMAIRRVTAFMISYDAFGGATQVISTLDRLFLPFTISVLILIGLWSMLKNFETFEVVEKDVKEKARKFSQSFKKTKEGK